MQYVPSDLETTVQIYEGCSPPRVFYFFCEQNQFDCLWNFLIQGLSLGVFNGVFVTKEIGVSLVLSIIFV